MDNGLIKDCELKLLLMKKVNTYEQRVVIDFEIKSSIKVSSEAGLTSEGCSEMVSDLSKEN